MFETGNGHRDLKPGIDCKVIVRKDRLLECVDKILEGSSSAVQVCSVGAREAGDRGLLQMAAPAAGGKSDDHVSQDSLLMRKRRTLKRRKMPEDVGSAVTMAILGRIRLRAKRLARPRWSTKPRRAS